jgi:hypothetical protein
MSLLLAWVVFPAVLILLATGCGLLLRVASGWDIPAALVPAAGLATIVVVTGFLTMSGATAELSTPVCLGLAVAGFGLTSRWAVPDLSRWEVLAATGVFAVFAAPVVLSGEATFAGYIKLDDTATWMAFTDRLMEHGRSASGLDPSTYEATIAVNLPQGYPVGAFLPLGTARVLVGQDLAWLVQPYMATMAAMLSLVLAHLARPLIRTARPRALVAFLAAQPALLFGYSLWGGIKEIAAAVMIALVAAAAATLAGDWPGLRRLLLPAVAGAALLATLGAGGAVWLATILIPTGLLVARAGFGRLLPRAVVLGGLLLLTSIPVLFGSGKLFSPTQGALVNDSELGNLLGSLNGFQIVGIWPAGDFRLHPGDMPLTYVLIGLAIAVALIGLYAAVRARALGLVLYSGATLAGCLVIVLVASPWVDGKALASASPAALLLACAGAAFLWGTEARIFGAVALAAIGAAVIWSNVLGYRNVNLAPRDQLAELQRIGNEIAGQGPTLTTDSEVYGGRHFLRDADPENSSDLRRSQIPLVGGGLPDEVPSVDTDQLQLDALLAFRTLVLQRTPSRSRPPAPYALIDSGRFYDVWQRPVGSEGSVLSHLGLGEGIEPSSAPACSEIRDLARLARRSGPGARLAAAEPHPITQIATTDTAHPPAWEMPGQPGSLFLTESGDLGAQFSTDRPGRYQIWLGGSVRGEIEATVDGRELGSLDGHLANTGEYAQLGDARLSAGPHQLLLRYDSKPLSPGTSTPKELSYPTGPLAVSSTPDDPGVRYVEPDQAGKLCGRDWDWVEALGQ